MSGRSARMVVAVGMLGLLVAPASGSALINGGFELEEIAGSGNWEIFVTVPGWELSRGPSIELQDSIFGWDAAEGTQWIELDSDIDGPGGSMNGEDASSAVFQDIATIVGETYVLDFAFSPRPGVLDNVLEVSWGGQILDTLSANGQGLSNTSWDYFHYEVIATSVTTRLAFGDRSQSDSFGTLLDDVTLAHTPEPATMAVFLAGLAALGRRRSRHGH